MGPGVDGCSVPGRGGMELFCERYSLGCDHIELYGIRHMVFAIRLKSHRTILYCIRCTFFEGTRIAGIEQGEMPLSASHRRALYKMPYSCA